MSREIFDSLVRMCYKMRMPPRKRVKIEKRFCPYCEKMRGLKLFKEGADICDFCLVFDKAAQITAPKST